VRIVLRLRGPEQIGTAWTLPLEQAGGSSAIPMVGDNGRAFTAMGIRGINVSATVHASAIHEHFCAILKRVLNGVSIEVLVNIRRAIGLLTIMPSAQGLCLHWPGVLHPTQVVNVVNVKVVKTAAAGPQEAMKVLN